jgi:hypothetical protein
MCTLILGSENPDEEILSYKFEQIKKQKEWETKKKI